MKTMTPRTDIDILQEKSAEIVADLLTEIGIAHAKKDRAKENEAFSKLLEVLRRTNGIGDLLGRKRTLEQLDAPNKKQQFAEAVNPFNFSLELSYNVPFEEAMNSIIQGPSFQNLPQSSLNKIVSDTSKIYGENAPVKSLFGAMQARNEARQRADEILYQSLANGLSTRDTADEMKDAMGKWSRATGETIYRTQVAKAYSAGQWRQIEDPIVRTRIGAIQFQTAGDRNVRPMHKAWHGFLGNPRDPIWEWITPPIDFNCRCAMLLLPHDTLKRMGQIDNKGNLKAQRRPPIPVPNFGRRPNKNVYSQYGVA